MTAAVGTEGTRGLLQTFRRSLRLEAGAVAADPALLWQQLSNRLREYDALVPALLSEEDRRLQRGSPPWFRVLSPLPESPQLLGSIGAHGDVAFLDRERLVTLHAGTLTFWDAPSGLSVADILLEDGAEARTLVVDDLGTVAVVAAPDGLHVHDLGTGALVSRLESSGAPVPEHDRFDAALMLELGISGGLHRALCLSPDGSLVAGAQASGAVTVWDTTTGTSRCTFPEDVAPLTACAFTPDADTLVFATRDGAVRAWRHGRGHDHDVLEEPPSTSAALVLGIAVAPDGSFAATVTGDRIIVQDLPSGHRRWSQEHFGSGRCCATTPDGRHVVTGGERGVLRLWDAASGTITGTLAGHTGTVERCAISTDGSLLASAAPDGIRVWDLSVPGGSEFFDNHADRVTALAFSPDGEQIASAGADRRVLLWDSTSRRRLGSLDGHEDAVQDCAFSRPDGSELVTAGRDGTARLWDVPGREEKLRLAGGLDPWWGCAVRPGVSELLLCGAGTMTRLALPSGARLATYPRDTETMRAAFAPDGTWAVVTGADGAVAFWDAATDATVDASGHAGTVGACAVSPDGMFAVTAAEDATVRIWDRAGRVRHVLRHDAAVWGCAVTADARYVVSTSWDRTLRVWDAEAGRELMRLELSAGLHGCTAHPWRTRIAFGDHTGRVHVVEPIGLPAGPVVVTARDENGVLHARCPGCATVRGVAQTDLGTPYDCPCGLATRVAEQPLRVTAQPAEPETDGLAATLGSQTPRERVLMHATKTCVQCGHDVELLRHACPRCGSAEASPHDVEATQFMQMRQARAADLVDRGALLFQSGQLDEAETTFRLAADANPWNATACGNLGVVLLRRGEKQEALAWVEKAVGIDPNVPGGRELVARLRAELPQPVEAQTSADDEVAAAGAAAGSGDGQTAVLHLRRAIELVEGGQSCAVTLPQLYGQRATALARLGDYRSSLADLDRALQLEPDEWHHLDARGRAHYVLGQYREAVADWSAALDHLPADGDAPAGVLLYRAAAHRQLDQPAEALADLELADAARADPGIGKGIEDLRRTILSEAGLD